jgi:hypothetical protein
MTMNEQTKLPRGRPRKYSEEHVSVTKHNHELITSRGAQNIINFGHALIEICDYCTIETQRYFLGGNTGAELRTGERKKRKILKYAMEEMGRHPREEIVEIAEAIANNRAFDTWTQQEIVDFLKDIRLGRDR